MLCKKLCKNDAARIIGPIYLSPSSPARRTAVAPTVPTIQEPQAGSHRIVWRLHIHPVVAGAAQPGRARPGEGQVAAGGCVKAHHLPPVQVCLSIMVACRAEWAIARARRAGELTPVVCAGHAQGVASMGERACVDAAVRVSRRNRSACSMPLSSPSAAACSLRHGTTQSNTTHPEPPHRARLPRAGALSVAATAAHTSYQSGSWCSCASAAAAPSWLPEWRSLIPAPGATSARATAAS